MKKLFVILTVVLMATNLFGVIRYVHYVEYNIKPRGGTKLYGGFDGDENSFGERGNPWNDIEKTTIDGNNEWTCVVITLGNNVVVDGFNIIRGHEGTGTYDRAGGVRVWGKTDVILRNLNIHDCYAAQGAGILIDTEQNSGSVTVEYVIVYNCNGTCGAVEVAFPTKPSVSIRHCTIVNNNAYGLEWAGSDEPYRMNHDWYNNIVWNNNNPRVSDVQENLWRWAREFSSDSYAGGARWTDFSWGEPGANMLFETEVGGPGFVSGSFRLAENSPCIDAGRGGADMGALPYCGPVIPDPAELAVSPTTLNIGTGSSGVFTVSNVGDEELDWQASENETWMNLSPTSGNLSGGSSRQVTVTINRTGLEPGNYSGVVSVTSNGGDAAVTVNMSVVEAAPILDINPTTVYYNEGIAVRNVTIGNAGTANLTWNAYENPEENWILSLNPSSGLLIPGQTVDMTVTVDNNIEDGTYQGIVTVTSNGGNENIQINMTLETDSPDYLVRVNCGSDTAFIDDEGNVWSKDQKFTWAWGYVDGSDYYTLHSISNTVNDGLYQTNRMDLTEYKFDGSNGHYEIRLLFAELRYDEEWQSRFDVYCEGDLKISNLDLVDLYGKYYATERMFEVDVTDGVLNIVFADRHPQVSGIEVKGFYGVTKEKGFDKAGVKAEMQGKIWPNPFQYQVNVVEPDLKNVKMYDVLGRRVLETEKGSFVMDGGLPTGVYFFRVETVENELHEWARIFFW